MISGFLLGIFAAFFWSITNLVDKFLISRYSKDGNVGGVFLLSCFFPVILLPISLFYLDTGFSTSKFEVSTLVLSGFLMVAWIFFYLKALSEDEASVVMTMLILAPFFSLIFASLMLGELLRPVELFAGFLIICGALIVSYEPNFKDFKWPLLFYAVSASLITGLMHTLFKFVTIEDHHFWESMFWRSFGMVLAGAVIYFFVKSYRVSFRTFIKQHYGTGISLNTANETLTLIGDTIFAFAILLAPLAIVQATEAYQPVFILILVFLLSSAGYTLVTENFSDGKTILKIIGIAMALSGGVLLSVMS